MERKHQTMHFLPSQNSTLRWLSPGSQRAEWSLDPLFPRSAEALGIFILSFLRTELNEARNQKWLALRWAFGIGGYEGFCYLSWSYLGKNSSISSEQIPKAHSLKVKMVYLAQGFGSFSLAFFSAYIPKQNGMGEQSCSALEGWKAEVRNSAREEGARWSTKTHASITYPFTPKSVPCQWLLSQTNNQT